MKVETKEGEGAEFIIQLPISDNIKSNKSLNPINRGSDILRYIKAHGGELKVETKEGEFAEFIITLPNEK
jgi:chemotaxis protein histidine kinase CheA